MNEFAQTPNGRAFLNNVDVIAKALHKLATQRTSVDNTLKHILELTQGSENMRHDAAIAHLAAIERYAREALKVMGE